MKQFEYYLNGTDVKKISPDPELAKSLIKDMLERIDKISKLDLKVFSKIIFENTYDALRDFCDALLSIDGLKSYSHKASIAYLAKYKFDSPTLEALDQFRAKRNDSKYYGYAIPPEDTEEITAYYKKIKNKIYAILKEKKLK